MTATRTSASKEPLPERPTKARPGVRSTLLAFLRIEFVEEISYPMSFVFTMLRSVMPLLLSFFIGQLIRDPRVGGDYLTFVTIGLGVSAMLSGALAGFGGSMSRAFQRGTLETYLVEPVPWTFLPLAMNTWQLLLGIVNGTLLMLVGWLLGADYVAGQIPAFIFLVFLGVIATTAIGLVSASVLMLTLKAQPVLYVYGMAAGLLAGAVFSVSQLPTWLKIFSFLIPHTYVINGSRSLLMEDPGSFEIPYSTAVFVLLGFGVIVFPLGVWLFRRALEFARRMGVLSGY
ncbi:MAG: ABC transporter permease [Actinomycetota bacterium]